MCAQERNLSDPEVVELVKDFTTDHALAAVEFYLGTNSTWHYKDFIEHLRMSFKLDKTFISLDSNFLQ